MLKLRLPKLLAGLCALIAVITTATSHSHATPSQDIGDPIPNTPQNFVMLALTSMGFGIYAEGPAWEAAQDLAINSTQNAKTYQDTFPALAQALKVAGGESAHLCPVGSCPWLKQQTAPVTQLPTVSPQRPHDRSVGYLTLPSIQSMLPGEDQKYTTALGAVIAQQKRTSHCGWIIDLRNNQSSNPWPILGGLSAFLTDGPDITYASRPGLNNNLQAVIKGDSLILDAGRRRLAVPASIGKITTPVAILQDEKTKGGGEAVLVAFKGQPNVQSFGTHSYGNTTPSVGFDLPYNQGTLTIPSFFEKDRHNNDYFSNVQPDHLITGDPTTAALHWLHSQCHQ